MVLFLVYVTAHELNTLFGDGEIAASNPNRRIGCNVTSAASFGSRQRSRKLPIFWRSARYSGRYLPACRIILVDASASYLIRQFESGVDAVQIFDSWAAAAYSSVGAHPRQSSPGADVFASSSTSID
jgi:hypothetical protein